MKSIIAGASNKELAKKVALDCRFNYIDACSTKFADGEIRINIKAQDIGEEIFILQSLSNPVNDHLMELLLIADAVRRRFNNKKITAIIPYLCYTRQDRMIQNSSSFSPISISLIASLIEAAKIDKVITIDLHSPKIVEFFKIPILNLTPTNLFKPIINKNQNSVIVSPDIGGIDRAKNLSKLCGLDFVFINKQRSKINKCRALELSGDVKNKNCILVDDIIDTGGTFIEAIKLLKSQGAKNILGFATHGVLSGNCRQLLMNTPIDQIYLTDTIKNNNLPQKFQIISECSVIANTLNAL